MSSTGGDAIYALSSIDSVTITAVNMISSRPSNFMQIESVPMVNITQSRFRAENSYGQKAYSGVYLTTVRNLILQNSFFQNLNSSNGGALRIVDTEKQGKFIIKGTIFENCYSDYGGAIDI